MADPKADESSHHSRDADDLSMISVSIHSDNNDDLDEGPVNADVDNGGAVDGALSDIPLEIDVPDQSTAQTAIVSTNAIQPSDAAETLGAAPSNTNTPPPVASPAAQPLPPIPKGRSAIHYDLEANNVVFFSIDLEHGGDYAGIMQLSSVAFNLDGEELGNFNQFVKPPTGSGFKGKSQIKTNSSKTIIAPAIFYSDAIQIYLPNRNRLTSSQCHSESVDDINPFRVATVLKKLHAVEETAGNHENACIELPITESKSDWMAYVQTGFQH